MTALQSPHVAGTLTALAAAAVLLSMSAASMADEPEPVEPPLGTECARPPIVRDPEVIALIKRYYGDEEASKELHARPRSEVFDQLLVALEDDDRDVVHNATTLLRDSYGSAQACEPVRALLVKLLAEPSDKTLSTRMVCCQILAKFPNEASIPILIRALDDPGEDYSMVPAPGGTAEHLYRAVWVESLRALRSIAGEPISSYTGHGGVPSPKAREKWVAEAKTWWEKQKKGSL